MNLSIDIKFPVKCCVWLLFFVQLSSYAQKNTNPADTIYKNKDYTVIYNPLEWEFSPQDQQTEDTPAAFSRKKVIAYNGQQHEIRRKVTFDYFLLEEEDKKLSVEPLLHKYDIENSKNLDKYDYMGFRNMNVSLLGNIRLGIKDSNQVYQENYVVSGTILNDPAVDFVFVEMQALLYENVIYTIETETHCWVLLCDFDQIKSLFEFEKSAKNFFRAIPKKEEELQSWYNANYIADKEAFFKTAIYDQDEQAKVKRLIESFTPITPK